MDTYPSSGRRQPGLLTRVHPAAVACFDLPSPVVWMLILVIWSSFQDFRRCLRAQPGMLSDWQLFIDRFDGQFFQGPFSRMLTNMNGLGWTILRPPAFQDHEGLVHNFTQVPDALLRQLAEHAWLQHVARLYTHRKTMSDAVSLEPSLLLLDSARMPALSTARVSQERFSFRLFDSSLDGLCPRCQVKDENKHRLCECPAFANVRADPSHPRPPAFVHRWHLYSARVWLECRSMARR